MSAKSGCCSAICPLGWPCAELMLDGSPISREHKSMPKRRRKRGRPRTGHDSMVGVRLPMKIIKKIERVAEALRCDRSSAIRWMINDALERGRTSTLLRSGKGQPLGRSNSPQRGARLQGQGCQRRRLPRRPGRLRLRRFAVPRPRKRVLPGSVTGSPSVRQQSRETDAAADRPWSNPRTSRRRSIRSPNAPSSPDRRHLRRKGRTDN